MEIYREKGRNCHFLFPLLYLDDRDVLHGLVHLASIVDLPGHVNRLRTHGLVIFVTHHVDGAMVYLAIWLQDAVGRGENVVVVEDRAAAADHAVEEDGYTILDGFVRILV